MFEHRDDLDPGFNPEVGVPPDIRARWEIEDAVAEVQGVPHRAEEAEAGGVEPVHGYPYESGTGVTDFSALEPAEPGDVFEEIRASIAEVIAQEQEQALTELPEDIRRLRDMGLAGMDDGMPGPP